MRNLEGGFLRVVMWYPWQREDYVMAFRWHRFPWPMCNNGNRLCLLVWCVCHGNGNRWKWAVNSVWIKWASWAPVRAERRILNEWSFPSFLPSFHPSFLPSFLLSTGAHPSVSQQRELRPHQTGSDLSLHTGRYNGDTFCFTGRPL